MKKGRDRPAEIFPDSFDEFIRGVLRKAGRAGAAAALRGVHKKDCSKKGEMIEYKRNIN